MFEDLAKFRGMLLYNMPIIPGLCSKLAYYAGVMLDALAWLLCLKLCWHNQNRPTVAMCRKVGTVIFHYLDNFITVRAPRSDECFCNVAIMEDTCIECGILIEFDKSEGTNTALIFLVLN